MHIKSRGLLGLNLTQCWRSADVAITAIVVDVIAVEVIAAVVPAAVEEEFGSVTLHIGPSALASVHAHTSHTCAWEESADSVAR